jgi:hypothetical protein
MFDHGVAGGKRARALALVFVSGDCSTPYHLRSLGTLKTPPPYDNGRAIVCIPFSNLGPEDRKVMELANRLEGEANRGLGSRGVVFLL